MTTITTTCFRSIVGAMLIIASTSTAFSAQFSERLNTTLADVRSNEVISVLVFMSEQLDVEQVKQVRKLTSFSRQAAHKLLVDELREFAAEKQLQFQRTLEAAVSGGEVESFESYWITNAFRISASRSFIESLKSRPDIEAVIVDLPPTSLYNPNHNESGPIATGTSSQAIGGLRTIGADEMWQMGYTGTGRLIASFDTGVDGSHPALSGSWRGNTHSAAESWFDPVYQEETPHWNNQLSVGSHGTSTLGIMVGKNDATGDTVGVAFGAQWISAMVVDIPGANYLQAFQWAADPDGNPNTIEDVPDVLNNSWGFLQDNIDCSDLFWTPIDNLEALGTVVIFACGNEGPDDGTIRNPANRATSELNTFAVGATDSTGSQIWQSSSRGPSDCDGVSIKPEVVAPGADIWTTVPGPTFFYGRRSGTSFAAPHVSGAVALLRDYNPNATVDQIKSALLNSAVDIAPAGQDNTTGYGLINIPAAMALLPTNNQVNIFVQTIEHNPITAGMQVSVVATLKNSGVGTLNVNAELLEPETGVTIVNGASSFGDLPFDAGANNSSDPFVLQFDNGIVNGTQLSVDLHITATAGYEKTVKLYFTVGEALVKSIYTHQSDSLRFTISNVGAYGLAPGSVLPNNGVGFLYPVNGVNNLYQAGLLVGNSPLGVSDAITNTIFSVDADFRVAPGGNLQVNSGGILGDHETYSRFDDGHAYRPLGITIEQRTASFNGSADANYVIMEYTVINDQDTAISDLYVGMYFDWDFPPNSGQDRTGLDEANQLGYMWHNNLPQYRGTSVLNHEGLKTYWAIPNSAIIYDGVTEQEQYDMLTRAIVPTSNFAPDQSYSISTGPFNLGPGESDTAAFAVITAGSAAELTLIAQRAKSLYRQATPVDDDGVALPNAYQLEQNFPNPFNPVTQIQFNLNRAEIVQLQIFNSLGQKVATLLDDLRAAGMHTVYWNGVDDNGQAVATGVYFYKLTAGSLSETRKMVLLK